MANKIDDTLITELAGELGVTPEAVSKVMERHRRAGDLVITRGEDTLSRGKAGVQAVSRLLDNKLAHGEAPQAVGATLGAVCQVIGTREYAPEQVPGRPREKGLPDSLFKWADALEAQPGKLAITNSDAARHRARGTRVQLLRSLLGEILVSADLLLDNLAVEEREAADQLLSEYKLVRTAAQSNRVLGELLGEVEDYFFGPQKQGAETRALGRARAAALTEKVTQRARLSADSSARKELADNLGAVLETFATRGPDDKPQGR